MTPRDATRRPAPAGPGPDAPAANDARNGDDPVALAGQCQMLYARGELQAVRDTGHAALPSLAAAEHAVLRFETLRLMQLACLEAAAFEDALQLVQRLQGEAQASGDPGQALMSAFALAATLERIGDPWQALRVLEQAVRVDDGRTRPRERMIARNGVCAIAIGMLHRLGDTLAPEERRSLLQRAIAAGTAAREGLAEAPDPVYEVAVLGNLGEAQLHDGSVADGLALIEQAAALALERGLRGHGWRVQASLGEARLVHDRVPDALAAMQALLAEMGAGAPMATALRAHHVAYRAAKALGQDGVALEHLERFERLERERAVHQLRAQSELFVTRSEAQQAQQQAERQAEQARAAVQQERERAAEYQKRAEQDALTGLGNRRFLDRRMAELLPAMQAAAQPLALALVDLDHFKAVNDGFGHPAGDRVLVEVAALLRAGVRDGDVLARLGGEEFVVVLPGLTCERAHEICERLRRRVLDHAFGALPSGYRQSVSIGLACAPGWDAAELMHRADRALYVAKAAGRDRVQVAPAAPAALG